MDPELLKQLTQEFRDAVAEVASPAGAEVSAVNDEEAQAPEFYVSGAWGDVSVEVKPM